MADKPVSQVIDTTVPSPARLWDYLLGGKDHYAVDREAAENVLKIMPSLRAAARADRAFLRRAVRYLAEQEGIRQFLDIGTGLPTGDNTHQVAQSIAPESRIVYVDNDPVVMVHARALLTSDPRGATDYVEADLRDPGTILREASRTLDFDRPIALMLLGVVNFVPDDDLASRVVARLIEDLSSGSFLVMAHPTQEVHSAEQAEAMRTWRERGGTPIVARSKAQITAFFDGLELLEPGVVTSSRWRPEVSDAPEVTQYSAVGRKP